MFCFKRPNFVATNRAGHFPSVLFERRQNIPTVTEMSQSVSGVRKCGLLLWTLPHPIKEISSFSCNMKHLISCLVEVSRNTQFQHRIVSDNKRLFILQNSSRRFCVCELKSAQLASSVEVIMLLHSQEPRVNITYLAGLHKTRMRGCFYSTKTKFKLHLHPNVDYFHSTKRAACSHSHRISCTMKTSALHHLMKKTNCFYIFWHLTLCTLKAFDIIRAFIPAGDVVVVQLIQIHE